MTTNGDMQQIADHMGISGSPEFFKKLNEDIECELESLTLFDDAIPVLNELKRTGARMAICSNLASPYGVVIDHLLSAYSLERYLSYECGFIKPEPEIYQNLVLAMGVEPQHCLFVGDTYLAGVVGPKQVGMESIHLCRSENATQNSIRTLAALIDKKS